MKKVLLTLVSLLAFAAHAQYPKDFSLTDLEKEINKPQDCTVLTCATVNKVTLNSVELATQQLSLSFSVDARTDSVVALPLNNSELVINSIQLNQKPWLGAYLKDNKINVAVLKGKNNLTLNVSLRGQSMELVGFHKNFSNESNAVKVLNRNDSYVILLEKSADKEVVSETKLLNKISTVPFFQVSRTLLLENKWKVHTTVSLLNGVTNVIPQVVTIDAMPGESILSDDFKIEDKKIKVNISSQPVEWDSIVEEKNELQFMGNKNYLNKLTVLNNSNWLFNFSSLTPTLKNDNTQYASAYEWLFWPEDKLVLKINKPIAVKGNTAAIQSISTHLDTEKSPDEYVYSIELKSSLGTKIDFSIPDALKLNTVFVNNQNIPFTQEDKNIHVDINSGNNSIKLVMSASEEIGILYRYPVVGMKIPATNYSYDMTVPTNRWVLWTGGTNIHASVLLWGILICCVMFAYVLAKGLKTPLSWLAWSLLLVGLSQSGLEGLFFIISWFVILTIKTKHADIKFFSRRFNFNLFQVLAVFLTLMVFSSVVQTVAHGLLNYPNIFPEGNETNASNLHWYSEQVTQFSPWMISLPLWVYRTLMFAWSIWFAFNIMNWLKWAWESFSTGGLWIAPPVKVLPPIAEVTED